MGMKDQQVNKPGVPPARSDATILENIGCSSAPAKEGPRRKLSEMTRAALNPAFVHYQKYSAGPLVGSYSRRSFNSLRLPEHTSTNRT